MRKRIIRDISASSVQVIVNQLAGLILFFITSSYLTKTMFGQLSWALAVLLVCFAVLGCGMDQITVRKIAAGEDAPSYLRIYLFHVLAGGLLFLFLLLLVCLLTGWRASGWELLFFLAIGQFFTLLSLPFKQIANGKEAFRTLMVMSVGGNLVKVAGLLLLAWAGTITLGSFVALYVAASALELLVSVYAGWRSLHLRPAVAWDRPRYIGLIRESLPQLGVILCTAGIARFDWILLGIISTAPILAEYSFAYRAFELSSLPLLILAPLLLPMITRWFTANGSSRAGRTADLLLLARLEMALACGCCLLLNLVWSPVVDALTGNKYGAVNATNFLLLSCALPFLYINNILWSIHFALGRMRFIFFVFLVTLLLTCTGDLILIPLLQGKGAAIAYLVATVIQTIQFTILRGQNNMGTDRHLIPEALRFWQPLLLCGACATLSGLLVGTAQSVAVFHSFYSRAAVAVVAYIVLLFASRQLSFHDWVTCKRVIYA